ncbi:MAG: DUF1800 domain-containing protein [Leadbetterella sp.]
MKFNFTFFLSFFAFCSSYSQTQRNQVVIGMGNVRGATVTASSSSTNGVRTLSAAGLLPNHNSASRFLGQASLGHNLSQITNLTQVGFESWLNTQLNMSNQFGIETYLRGIHQSMVDSLNRTSSGNTLDNVGVGNWHFDISYFQGSMVAQDVLRWKVALALSEIFVTSRISTFDGNPYALASYYDMLLRNSLGNFRTLLTDVTYHPTMAVYLTYMNNKPADNYQGRQTFPDENYAREIMQLFTIGLYRLNMDGTEQKDANNLSIPTYTNTDIAGLARVFTGLSWGNANVLGQNPQGIWKYTQRMKFFPKDRSRSNRVIDGHDAAAKSFLGLNLPARTDTLQYELDITQALDHLFNHQNVGPFIARRLIQRLVKSNPSPAYIQRVATVFANNGSGVRGDMKSVIRAILMDTEARECCNDELDKNSFGMLREPFVRYMQLVKAVPLTNTGNTYRNVMYNVYQNLGQTPLYAPSVFNFFLPDYAPDGPVKNSSKYAPEFQLLNSQSFTGYQNSLHYWIVNDGPTEYWNLFNNETYKPDQDPGFNYTNDLPLTANNRLIELIDKYNMILANGRLSPNSVNFIKNAIMAMPPSVNASGVINTNLATDRVRILIYLIMSSPDYLITK